MSTSACLRALAPLLLALSSTAAVAQSESWNADRSEGDAPGIGGLTGGLDGRRLQHGPYCCEEQRWLDEERQRPPRTGPQYEYQNVGEPWDSHARWLRARDERRDAERDLERRRSEYRDAAHDLDVHEMYPQQWGPDPLDEYGYEFEEDYLHARDNRDQAEDRYDRAVAEEHAAREANDAAVEDFEQWQSDQPQRDFPPYEGRPVLIMLPDRENAPLGAEEMRQIAERLARDEYYGALRRHADGTADFEEVQAAYQELRMWR